MARIIPGLSRFAYRRTSSCAVLLLCLTFLTGCPSTSTQRRAREFNEDGVHLFSKGDFRNAADSFDLALTLTPGDAGVIYNLGQCYDRLGDDTRAEQYYTQCLQMDPKNTEARHAYAALLYRLGRSAQANRMIEDWLASEPSLADAHALEAWRLRQQRAYPEAQDRLHHALALDPGNRLAMTELAILYEQTNMPDRALVLYERVLARYPGQSDIQQRVDDLRSRKIRHPRPD